MSQPSLDLRPAADVLYGRVGIQDNKFVIDAEPHVMQFARKLFPTPYYGGVGKFTHQVIMLDKRQDAAKDLVWFNDRYALDFTEEAWREATRLAAIHDRRVIAARIAANQTAFDVSREAFHMAEPPREHQIVYRNLHRGVHRILNADCIGGGKTISHIATLVEPDTRPALVVVQPHLLKQWEQQVKRFMPEAKTFRCRTGIKKHIPPGVDVVLCAYTSLSRWQDQLGPYGFKSIGFDEVQELRKTDTVKRHVASLLSDKADYASGYSATPIYNYGSEIWSVLDVISPGCLGTVYGFQKEWCTGDRVNAPVALNAFLKTQGLMIRRTYRDIYGANSSVQKEIITLEGDIESLKEIQDIAKQLAMSVLSNRVGESEKSATELDWKLRQATGIAKARPTAEFVKMLVDSGEKVLLFGWHREVYEIWKHEFKHYGMVMCTGSESPTQKETAKKRFMTDPNCQIFVCSLRSGAGIDGLQLASHVVVFGELDWSPHVMDQDIGRLDREGQKNPVLAYFMTIDDGADPFMIERIGDKRSQHEGILDGEAGEAKVLEESTAPMDRLRALAENYLAMIGEPIPTVEPMEGLHAEVASLLRRVKVPSNTEREMQMALAGVLPEMLPDCEVIPELRIGERSRLDFLVVRGEERIAIECKIDQTGRAAVYRQVRRYAEEAQITGLVLFAPWSGVPNFVVEEVPVTVVDWAKAKL